MSADEKEVKRMELEMLSEKFNAALSDVYIDPSEEVELPPVAISQGTYKFYSESGVEDLPLPLCTYGNISVIMAYPKVGKSFCISLLTSTFLAGHVQGAGTRRLARPRESASDRPPGTFDSARTARAVAPRSPACASATRKPMVGAVGRDVWR